jgi:hypothetical protein
MAWFTNAENLLPFFVTSFAVKSFYLPRAQSIKPRVRSQPKPAKKNKNDLC